MELVVFFTFLTLPGVAPLCEGDKLCMAACSTKPRDHVDDCLDVCRQHSCNQTEVLTPTNTDGPVVRDPISFPTRWLPTIIGALVGVGVLAAVIYYFRRSWSRRDRFPGYGFSRLRRGRGRETDVALREMSSVAT
ncbi:uncharacterized protein LOC124134252 [Haliotis rufescens]|uniref:uncharacterized protein LOC124134252 n=1 Tax=Haliotis rufescens TaxID=6454 RepID=UPI00201F190A|nr:uncharacterized protein LOC124134252 [Haliotis rufescens]XP_046354932.2 uncharacterized protein LOC124134252 [Haliotis rufescens]